MKAIIIGGGMAGLLASRVLSEHFDEVIVIEKDYYKKRSGIPQANHPHILLARCREILIELFPDIEDKLLSKGANKIDFIKDARVRFPTGWSLNFESDLYTFTCSRYLLESVILDEITRYKNISILERKKVKGLIMEDNKVTGIRLDNDIIKGDLIVDASGRNSLTAKWLEERGLKIKVSRVNSYIGYATKIVELDEEPEWKSMVIFPKPNYNTRMGVMLKIENNKWMVGALGINKNYPPTDDYGFLDYLNRLEDNSIYNLVKNARTSSKIYGYREIGSRMYHYEKIKMPKNLIVIGDAVTSLNPIYGQGITISAITSLLLHNYNDLSIQKKILKVSKFPWLLGTSEDLRFELTEGCKPNIITNFLQWFIHSLMLLSTKDREVAEKFAKSIQMVEEPSILLKPQILLKVLLKT